MAASLISKRKVTALAQKLDLLFTSPYSLSSASSWVSISPGKGKVHVIRTLFLFAALFLHLSTALNAGENQYPLLTVEDGDTLVVLINKQATRIQLVGIDAPEDVPNPKYAKDIERTQLEPNRLLALGKSASLHLTEILGSSSQVQLRGRLSQKDRYGRIPAIVLTTAGESVNQQMVSSGYAVAMKRGNIAKSQKQTFAQLESDAQSKKKGLWSIDAEAMAKWSGLNASQ